MTSRFTHISTAVKGISAIFTAIVCLVVPTAARAAGCPNEKLREESLVNPATDQPYSVQLPDCRAYELVSPPNTDGMPAILGERFGVAHQFLVTANASVFWMSQATPGGTGALPDGGYTDVFRSRRTDGGWTTEDVLVDNDEGNKLLVGASPDGESVLIESTISLVSEDMDNPTENVTEGSDLYLVREGAGPELVTRGEVPNTVTGQGQVGTNPLTNPELTAVGFETTDSLAHPLGEELATPGCYVWNTEAPIATLTNPNLGGTARPPRNCRYLAVAADGRPIIEVTSGLAGTGLIFASDPADRSGFPSGGGTRRLSGPTPGAASFDGMSPDANTVYLTTPDGLSPEAGEETTANVYAVGLDGRPTICLSCHAGGSPNVAGVEFAGESADGSTVYFTLAGALFAHDSAGIEPLAPSSLELEHLVVSPNGRYVVGRATVSGDLYELSAGKPPVIIGSSSASPSAIAVSDSGARVLFSSTTPSGVVAIEEWSDGVASRLSPIGAETSYEVLGVSGTELENVFFAGHSPLVVEDANQGTVDIYDARTDGGFPAPTEGPPTGQTPNPLAPVPAAYAASVTSLSSQLGALPDGIRPSAKLALKRKAKRPNPNSCKRGPVRRGARCVRKERERRKR